MAETGKANLNIKNLGGITEENALPLLLKNVKEAKKTVEEIFRKLKEREKVYKEELALLKEKEAAEEAEKAALEAESPVLHSENPEPEVIPEKPKKSKKAQAVHEEKPVEVKPDETVKEEPVNISQPEVTEAKTEIRAEIKPEIKTETKTSGGNTAAAVNKPAERVLPKAGERPQYKPPERVLPKAGERPQYKPPERPLPKAGERPQYKPPERPFQKPGERPQYTPGAKKPFERPPFQKPGAGGVAQKPPFPPKLGAIKKGSAIEIPQTPSKQFGNKKKTPEKNFEEKKALNKRSLLKLQVFEEDFDEDKSGYRKLRKKQTKEAAPPQPVKIEKAFVSSEKIPLKLLSEKLGKTVSDILKRLFKEGVIKTINDTIDYDHAALIAADFGIELELKIAETAEETLTKFHVDEEDSDVHMVKRAPVVTIMGHVDHGKTSLLDKIRSANVAEGEAGGITQHIGAYTITVNGKLITFLDTPGHAAFTAMRMRGASVTDIVVLVIAADDGVMPQTIEAINHAKAAKVSIIIAVNKIDKTQGNLDRIKQQLTEHEILIEEWGGDIMLAPVSAKTGQGINELLDMINVLADVKNLKANPDRKARGRIIEAKLDKGKGPVATVLIQNGTLKTGDNIVAGTVIGKVRAMINDKGQSVKEAGPSMAVSIIGLEEVPENGDAIYSVDQDKLSKLVAEERKNKVKAEMSKSMSKITLDDAFNKIAEGMIKGLNLIIKADVSGSAEALKESLLKLSNDEVKVSVLHSGAGNINESDVLLADSSKAIIIGFNVKPDANAKAAAERSGIDIKLYKIIYEAIEDVEKAVKGMLAPKFKETPLGKAEVRNVFKISGAGIVAGCYVTEGKILRNAKVRLIRAGKVIVDGNINTLKRFKDDVKEVTHGFECGIAIADWSDIKEGDVMECYIVEQV